jgi:rubrerythrin
MDIMADFNLQTALTAITARVDEADRAEREAKSRELAAAITNGHARARVMRAIEAERALTKQLVMLSQQPDGELKQIRLKNAINRLAEALAEQGRYGEAAEIVADDRKREEYEQLNGALQVPDDQACDCNEPMLKIGELGMVGQNAVKHVYRCPKCGFENIR